MWDGRQALRRTRVGLWQTFHRPQNRELSPSPICFCWYGRRRPEDRDVRQQVQLVVRTLAKERCTPHQRALFLEMIVQCRPRLDLFPPPRVEARPVPPPVPA